MTSSQDENRFSQTQSWAWLRAVMILKRASSYLTVTVTVFCGDLVSLRPGFRNHNSAFLWWSSNFTFYFKFVFHYNFSKMKPCLFAKLLLLFFNSMYTEVKGGANMFYPDRFCNIWIALGIGLVEINDLKWPKGFKIISQSSHPLNTLMHLIVGNNNSRNEYQCFVHSLPINPSGGDVSSI